MSELFDKLIIRFVFAIFLCLMLFVYKYVHSFIHPSSRTQILKKFSPLKNPADTLHLFARLIGLGIIISEFYFYMSKGIGYAIFDFFLQATIAFVIFMASNFIVESIILYNFEYNDEIMKRKNMAYAIITFSNSIGIAFLLKTVLRVSSESLLYLVFLWLFSIVIMGFALKSYQFVSKLSFQKLIIQQNPAIAYSYTGFYFGWVVIISSALNHPINNMASYSVKVLLGVLLSLIVYPIIMKGLHWVFKIQEVNFIEDKKEQIELESQELTSYGIYEGAIFFTTCFLTSVITGHIHFGTFYPT